MDSDIYLLPCVSYKWHVQPGTYDTLAHILYKPVPTSGSSGAPILDAEAGAVIGIVTGAAFLNRVEGRRGFGTPAEVLFEVRRSSLRSSLF